MNEEDDRRGVNAVSRRRRPGINGVPAVISRSGARAPTAAYDPRRRKGGWIARADRVSESTELPLEGLSTGPARRSRVLARRGERRHGRRCPLASIPRLVLRAVARARVRRRGGGGTNEKRGRIPLSLRRSLSVIALEGTPERRRRRRRDLDHATPDDLRAGEITR